MMHVRVVDGQFIGPLEVTVYDLQAYIRVREPLTFYPQEALERLRRTYLRWEARYDKSHHA